MKVGFFLLKFPLSSETFVLNQITAFIDMGFEVEIVALQKGDTENTHAAFIVKIPGRRSTSNAMVPSRGT